MASGTSYGQIRMQSVSFPSHAAADEVATRSPVSTGAELVSAPGRAGHAQAREDGPGPGIQPPDRCQGRDGRGLFAAEDRAGSRRVFLRSYPGLPGAVGQARRDVAKVLGGCPAAQTLILLLSEVATNAVRHSRSGVPGGHFTVLADMRRGEYVKVTVADDGGPWAERAADSDIEYSHGLHVVRELSAGMGVEGDGAGRAVWFFCGWTAA
jgi:serine/threonine-protein kinase RsbW